MSEIDDLKTENAILHSQVDALLVVAARRARGHERLPYRWAWKVAPEGPCEVDIDMVTLCQESPIYLTQEDAQRAMEYERRPLNSESRHESEPLSETLDDVFGANDADANPA